MLYKEAAHFTPKLSFHREAFILLDLTLLTQPQFSATFQ